MKKLLALVALGLSFTVSAANVKLGEVTFATGKTLVGQAGTLGEMIGVPGLGERAQALLDGINCKDRGCSLRQDGTARLMLYGDPQAVTSVKSIDELEAKFRQFVAVGVVPAKVTKAAFLEKNQNFAEKDGVLTDGRCYVTISDDGRWLVVGTEGSYVREALAGIGSMPAAQQAAVRVDLNEAAFATLVNLGSIVTDIIAKEVPGEDSEMLKLEIQQYTEILAQVKSASFTLEVNAAGVDLRAALVPQTGTELAKTGTDVLPVDPLAVFGKEALVAVAHAANLGSSSISYGDIFGIYRQLGLKFDYAKVEKKSDVASLCTIDVKAMTAYFMNSGLEVLGAIEGKADNIAKLYSDLLTKAGKFKAAGPAESLAVAFKDVELKTTPSERFVSAMPEYKGRKLLVVGVCSFYSMLRLFAADALKEGLRSQAGGEMMTSMVLSQFPPAGDSCIAYACFKEQDSMVTHLRVTKDELKNIAVAVRAGISMAELAGAAIGGSDAELLDDDDDDDDDED